MKKPQKIRKTVKRFLSDTPEEFGTVCYDVCVTTEKHHDLVEAHLRITDCNKVVNIGFQSYEKKHMAKRLKKLDNLISTLQEFRSVLTSKEVKEMVEYKLNHPTED